MPEEEGLIGMPLRKYLALVVAPALRMKLQPVCLA
jgi:hypothetical protein